MNLRLSSYYIRRRPQLLGTNAVHKGDCPFLPDMKDIIYLGTFNTPSDALNEAKLLYPKSECCNFCICKNQDHIKKPDRGRMQSVGLDLIDLTRNN